jgi:MoaA/NifB/PqqE/SkfB family radical SAM enzyme
MPVRDELSITQWEQILSDNIFSSIETLTITGGEPVLRTDLVELVDLFARRLIHLNQLSITTNGLLPDRTTKFIQNIARICLQNDIQLSVSVSVDGIGEVHDKIRGIAGAFNKIETTILQLKDLQEAYSFYLGGGCVVQDSNLDNLSSLEEWHKKMDFSGDFQLLGFHESYVSNLDKKEEIDFTDKNREILLSFIEKKARDKSLFKFNSYYWYDMLRMYKYGKPRKTICPMTMDAFVLDAYGDVYWCLSEPEAKIGNCISGLSCSEIYYNPHNLKIREYLKKNKCPTCNSSCLTRFGIRNNPLAYLLFLLFK